MSVGHKIYIVGGFDGVEYFNNCRVFDPVVKTWTEAAPMHAKRSVCLFVCLCVVCVCAHAHIGWVIGKGLDDKCEVVRQGLVTSPKDCRLSAVVCVCKILW